MSLAAGTRIGFYEIVAVLGAGGMGEVYRARDTRLGRDVALKVLPDLFASDADRVARFQREAQLLASLNHPNIAAIHGIEDDATSSPDQPRVRALVLELVEGDTLADRIRRAPLSIDDATAVARQIADALEAAHERGVIHRDLKPANVKITPDGKVKVLDFGLAKALDTAPSSPHRSHSPTLSLAGTMAGMVLGTAAYMSPEQAKGLPADQRSDVFSFGCVLYEMLVRRQAFHGDSAAETLAAVLMRAPELDALPPHVPPRLRALVQRCLEKDPKRRWQAIGDVRYELEAIAKEPAGVPFASVAPQVAVVPLWRRAISLTAVAIVAGALASAVTWWSLRPRAAPIVTRFTIPLDRFDPVLRASTGIMAFSPDGTKLVYAADRKLYVRSMGDLEARLIPGSDLDVTAPFFSPDGQWIGFVSAGLSIKKVAVTGGAAITMYKVDNGVYSPSWDGNQIVFVELGKGIMRVSADGGEAEMLVQTGQAEVAYGPQLLNGGTALLYCTTSESGNERWDKAQIIYERIGERERKVLVRGGSDARYLSSGHLVYALGGTVLAMPFDPVKGQAIGGPVPVVEGVMRAPNMAAGWAAAHFATAANGTLAYIPGTLVGLAAPKTLALVDRNGRQQRLGVPPQPYIHPRVSPDGNQLAVATDDGKDATIWIYDLQAGGSLRRLTFGGRNQFPIWSPDGQYVTFQSNREGDLGLFRQRADGNGQPERLTKPEPGAQHEPESWSPDGRVLSLDMSRGASQGVWVWSGEGSPRMFVDAQGVVEKHSVFSPDGKWLAYTAVPLAGGTVMNASIFVQPFPSASAKYQVASGAARTPLWSRDGKQLFYHDQNQNRLMIVDIRTSPTFSVGTPTAVPVDDTIHPIAQRNYDAMPDGTRFIVVLPASAGPASAQGPPVINVVLNWFEELRTGVPVK